MLGEIFSSISQFSIHLVLILDTAKTDTAKNIKLKSTQAQPMVEPI